MLSENKILVKYRCIWLNIVYCYDCLNIGKKIEDMI